MHPFALSDEDRDYCLRSHESFPSVLRDTGVGGQRFPTQVKCLHVHLAHTLAGGRNPVGERVLRMLEEGRDAEVCHPAVAGGGIGGATAAGKGTTLGEPTTVVE